MPTQLDRIQVTVTPDLAAALETARGLWPDLPTSQQVATLAAAGAAYLASQRDLHHQAIMETKGIMREAYPAGYLDALRDGWQW